MDNVLGLIGLARKAGRLEVGEEPVLAAVRSGKAKLTLLAHDAAENTVRRTERLCQNGGIPLLRLTQDKAALGDVLGRSVCAITAVTDAGLAAAIAKRAAAAQPDHTPLAQVLDEKAQKGYDRRREALAHEKNRKSGKRERR